MLIINLNIFVMKKKLLYLAFVVLFSALSVNAQTTVWDIGNNSSILNGGAAVTTDWPTGAAFPANSETVKSNLVIFPGDQTTYGNIVLQTYTSPPFPADGYNFVNRFQTGGSSVAVSGDALPTSRYNYFNVNGACTVKVWFRGGNSTTTRSMFVSNGTTVFGSGVSVNGTYIIFSANVTAAGKIYVYGDAGNNLYKIEVTGATVTDPVLATDSFQAESSVVVYAKDSKINLSNIQSSIKVSIYSALGSLVKSIETSADTSLDIDSGVYVVKLQSTDGEKTVKVIVQ